VETAVNVKGKALYPLLMAELGAMKALRPKGGLMLRRDGSGLPWGGKGEILTQVERISKKTILAAGLRPELTFTSLGRHGGATCHARGHPRNRLPAARRILGRTRIETWGEVV
jgi:hypothetical protein